MSDEEAQNQEKDPLGSQHAAEREAAIAAALAEFLDRTSGEEFVDVDAFCRDYRAIEEGLRPLLQALTRMDEPDHSNAEPVSAQQDPLPERLSGHKILGEIGAEEWGAFLWLTTKG